MKKSFVEMNNKEVAIPFIEVSKHTDQKCKECKWVPVSAIHVNGLLNFKNVHVKAIYYH